MPGWKPSISASYGDSPSADDKATACSRTSRTTSVSSGSTEAKSLAARASRQACSQRAQARAKASTRSDGDRDGAGMSVAHQLQIARVPGVRRCFCLGQIGGHFGRDQLRVRQPGQNRKLIRASGSPARRHHRRGVPAQHGARLADDGDLFESSP